MPVLHPAEIWKRSGRYDIDVVFKLKDRNDRDLVLAITHEEIVALHASQTIRSYRDLPQIWYHIQLKERDEPRSSGGVLRTREFTMKDSYTLDRDQAGLDEGYAKHEEAYDRIYTRCGLDFYKVESDTGHHGREPGARVHGAFECGRGPRGALQQVRLRRERRDGRLAHRPRAVPAERSRRGGRDAQREHDRGARAVPRHRCAHDRQGDAGRRRRRQGLARARARRPPPARAQAQQGAAPDDRARHARADRGGVRRQAGLDRARGHPPGRDRRHRRRRDRCARAPG